VERNKRLSRFRHVRRKSARQSPAIFHLDDLKQLIRGHNRIELQAQKIIVTAMGILPA
jgi:hypothetical protein